MFDKDHDGQISMSEVKEAVLQMGQTPNDKRIEELFKQVDLDGNGLISFSEFVRLVQERVQAKPDESEFRAMFEAFDKDKNGFIDREELRVTFDEIEMPLSEREVQNMMDEIGIQDGRIYFEGEHFFSSLLPLPPLLVSDIVLCKKKEAV